MAANYSLLKDSENELLEKFRTFARHVIFSWKVLYKTLQTDETISEEQLHKFFELEDQSNHFEAEILDDSIWAISRNQPVGNHLRFIIAILNSITDLERMADYVMSTAKFFYTHKKVGNKIYDLLVSSIKDSSNYIEKILDCLMNKKAVETYEVAVKYQRAYQDKYSNTMVELSKILHSKTAKEIANILTGAIIIFKHVERNVDHALNIAENFLYIKESDFFFTKKSKQIDKVKK